MVKVKLLWYYEIKSPAGSWEMVWNNEDVSISVDLTRDADYLILYESRAIIPDIYSKAITYKNKYKKIFTHDVSICDGEKIIKMPPFTPSWINEKERKIYPKSKLISMIASNKRMCNGHFYRLDIANKFPEKDHLYGLGRENKLENKIDGLRDYMFSVAMENDSYSTYYTEKILDCFLTGTIPIYWGSPDIGEIFNPEGIIKLGDLDYNKISPELYYERIDAVKENFGIASELSKGTGYMLDYIINMIK